MKVKCRHCGKPTDYCDAVCDDCASKPTVDTPCEVGIAGGDVEPGVYYMKTKPAYVVMEETVKNYLLGKPTKDGRGTEILGHFNNEKVAKRCAELLSIEGEVENESSRPTKTEQTS